MLCFISTKLFCVAPLLRGISSITRGTRFKHKYLIQSSEIFVIKEVSCLY